MCDALPMTTKLMNNFLDAVASPASSGRLPFTHMRVSVLGLLGGLFPQCSILYYWK